MYPEKKLNVTVNTVIAKDYIASKVTRNCPDWYKSESDWMVGKIPVDEGFRRTISSYQ